MLAPVLSRAVRVLSVAAAVTVGICGCSLLPAAPSSARPSPSSAPSSPSPSIGDGEQVVAGEDLVAALGVEDWSVGVVGLDVEAPEPPPGWTSDDIEDLLALDSEQYLAAHLRADLWAMPFEQARATYLKRLPAFYAQFIAPDPPAELSGRIGEITTFAPGVVARAPRISATSSARVDGEGRLWVDLGTISVQPTVVDGQTAVVVSRHSVSFAKDRSAPRGDLDPRYWRDLTWEVLDVDCASYDLAAIVPPSEPYTHEDIARVRAYIDAPRDPDPNVHGLVDSPQSCAGAPSSDA